MFWKRRDDKQTEQAALTRLRELCDSLERPLRFLADLDAVLPGLTEAERASIRAARPVQDRHHERLAEQLVQEFESTAVLLRSRELRPLRDAVMDFTQSWRDQEPDQLKVIRQLLTQKAA